MRLPVVAAACLAAVVIPAAPASAAGGQCVAADPGTSSCSFYTNGTGGSLVCAATRCVVSGPTNSVSVATGYYSYDAPLGTRLTLTVTLGTGVLADNQAK